MKVWVACGYDSPPHAVYSTEELAEANELIHHVFELEVDIAVKKAPGERRSHD